MSRRSKFLKNGLVNPTDGNHTGPEPQWDDISDLTTLQVKNRISKALNFYNYYLDRDDYLHFLLEYMARHGSWSVDDIKTMRKCPKEIPIATEGKFARIISMNGPGEHDGRSYHEFVSHKISAIIRYVKMHSKVDKELDEQTKKLEKNKAPVISPMKRLENKVNSEVIAHIDWALDDWIENNEVKIVNLTALLGGANIPAKGCKFVHDFLDKYLEDLRDAHSGECDQCVESYSFLTRRDLNKWIKTFEKMKEQVSKYEVANKKAIVRVKKTKPAIKQVENLKYLKEENGLKSIPPVRVCGAMNLYTYNVKTRKLAKYQSLTRDGLTVKGTTIKDYDESKSYTFTVREKVYAEITSALKKKDVVKAIDKIKESTKTKVTTPNGRCNEHTLLIWSK